MGSRSFKDLVVWQRSIALVKAVYELSNAFPRDENFGLSSQLRRAAFSIPSNIAEGSKRGSAKDFSQFLRIAMGSAAEVETQLIIVEEIYPSSKIQPALVLLDEVQKMLAVLLSRLGTKN
jgi:four helix bundle protein